MKKRRWILTIAAMVIFAAMLCVSIIRLARLPVYKGGGVFATLMPLPYEKMVDAPYILTGKVVKKEPREGIEITEDDIQRYCYSRVTLQVNEVIKGKVGKTFRYREDGGTSKEGWVYRVDYTNVVEIGDEVLIFAEKQNTSLTYETVFQIVDGVVAVGQEDLPALYLQRMIEAGGEQPGQIQLLIEKYLELVRDGIAQ